MPNQVQRAMRSEPIMLADHPALDLLNTVARIHGELVDSLQSDMDVLHWMERAGFSVKGAHLDTRPGSLLNAARILRDAFRRLVEKRKAGKRGDLSALNAFLAQGGSHPELVWPKEGPPHIHRVRSQHTPEQILAPVAEAAADLFVTGDFNLVKSCEDESCVLWFYDRTKSHHRRWCSMATCGNRHKVAAYRERRLRDG